MQRYLRAHGLRIGRVTFQAYQHARANGIVAQHQCRRIQSIDNDIKITIAVKIGRRNSVRYVILNAKPPLCTRVLKREVTTIAKRHVFQLERGKFPAPPLIRHAVEAVLQTLLHVRIHDVPLVTVRDKNILPAIEIDIHEQCAPRPTAGAYSRGIGHFGKRAIAAINEKRIALHLQLQFAFTNLLGQCCVRGHLRFQTARIVAQHVRFKNVGQTVTVHVSNVNTHGRVAHPAHGGPIGQAKVAAPVVVPQLIEIFEVVGDVQVGCTIAVEIDKFCRQPKRFKFFGELFATGVHKTT